MRSSHQQKKSFNPIDVVMTMIFDCITNAVGTIVALVIPVTVIVFIVLPIVPSSAQ